jgi:hypothetical protein
VSLTQIVRAASACLACIGVIDPSWSASRTAPPIVDLRIDLNASAASGAAGKTRQAVAEDVRRRLVTSLDGDVSFRSDADPAAVVLVGDSTLVTSLKRDDIPISTISFDEPRPPNVRIVAARSQPLIPAGWPAAFDVTADAVGVTGAASMIVLEQDGAELARREHKWTRDPERLRATLLYTPPTEGISNVTLRVVPVKSETTNDDNAVDLRLAASGRRLKVLAHEPRPSWATAFVRRALERDATFEVSAFVQASRGLEVRSGSPPAALTADALSAFDVVLVGAPEELQASDVEALRSFALRRGGTVVLLPDRRPSGRYLNLLPGSTFDELLVENAVALHSTSEADRNVLRASEFAIPRGVSAGAVPVASLEHGGTRRSVVLTWPLGAGSVMFSGALDAWRFRASADDGFSRFWRARVAEAALAAPQRLEVTVDPGVARPGEALRVRVQFRRTELEETADVTRVPAVRASLVGSNGFEDVLRLWPTAETGVFEARVRAPAVGQYNLHVTSGNGATADDVLIVVPNARHPADVHAGSNGIVEAIAASTGGVAVSAGDLAPLQRHLRSLPRRHVERKIRPAGSVWFVIAFAALLCGEWAVRRRRGRV